MCQNEGDDSSSAARRQYYSPRDGGGEDLSIMSAQKVKKRQSVRVQNTNNQMLTSLSQTENQVGSKKSIPHFGGHHRPNLLSRNSIINHRVTEVSHEDYQSNMTQDYSDRGDSQYQHS